MKIGAGSWAVLLAVVFAAPATAHEASPTFCKLAGWTNNDFVSDIPIHGGPEVGGTQPGVAPIIGRLPVTAEDAENASGDRVYSVRFDITASLNGWLKIENISDAYNSPETDRLAPMQPKSGWVQANAVRLRIQSARGFDAPRTTANRIVDFKDDWASDLGEIDRVIACDREWVLVDLRVKYRRDNGGALVEPGRSERSIQRAWFHGTCGNEETTCDMTSVDTGP